MMDLDPVLCAQSQKISGECADRHTRHEFAILDARLLQDLGDGRINHDEFLLYSVVDGSVNK